MSAGRRWIRAAGDELLLPPRPRGAWISPPAVCRASALRQDDGAGRMPKGEFFGIKAAFMLIETRASPARFSPT